MNWKIKKRTTGNVLDQLLLNRGVDLNNKQNFLNPSLTDLHQPTDLPDMDKAVEIFLKHAQKSNPIAIFADYDADGIPGGVFLKELCDQFKLKSIIYIPSRQEGYGLSEEAIDYFVKGGAKLMITIDCGVANLDEVKYARKQGLEIIILDHHETKKQLPKAQAVVDAKRPDNKYPFREISGAVVGFKFGQAVAGKNQLVGKKFLRWSLDLMGISTISDMVPLIDENRAIAKWGIEVLRQTKRPGLKALYQQAGIDPKEISSYNVGFQISPRINAPGRMDHANGAYYLLTESNPKKAQGLAYKIEKINLKRQQEIEKVFKEATDKIDKEKLDQNNLIIVKEKDWPKGIIGLVASRLSQRYYRPTIVLADDGQFGEGSARSIPGFNILSGLDSQMKLLKRYGGHAMAAGLKIKNENYQALYDNLIEFAGKNIKTKDLAPSLEIDMEINLSQITDQLYQKLKQLEPHGMANPRPVFASKQVEVIDSSLVGKKSDHLKLTLKQDKQRISAIAFNHNLDLTVKRGDLIDIAYRIDENNYLGKTSLQLNIKDIKKSDGKK